MKKLILAVLILGGLLTSQSALGDVPSSPNYWQAHGKSLAPLSGYSVSLGTATATNFTITGTCTGCGGGGGGIATSSPFSANYLPVATGSSPSLTNSAIYQPQSGYVDIGSSSPVSTLLVQGSGAINPFTIASSSGASALTVLANGYVGINTTSTPTHMLEVLANATTGNQSAARITQTNSGNNANTLELTTVGETYPNDIYINDASNVVAGITSHYALEIGSTNGIAYFYSGTSDILMQPHNSTNFDMGQYGLQIGSGAGSNPSGVGLALTAGRTGLGTTTPAQSLTVQGSGTIDIFNVASSSGTSVLRVTSAGNVGIGTTTPDNTIQVANLINFDNSTNSTWIGYQAGISNTTTNNTGLGYQALTNTTGGISNTAVGSLALAANTTGQRNQALGYQTLYSNTTGSYNTGMGTLTLSQSQTANYEVGVGYGVMRYAQGSGNLYNTAIGGFAMSGSTTPASNTGQQNVAIGANALSAYTASNNNIAIGYSALGSANNTSNDTAIGFNVGQSLLGGSNDILIGNNVDVPATSTSNYLSIGNLIFGTGLSNLGSASSTAGAGNVGIGTSTPANAGLTVANGDVYITKATSGIILKDTVSGTCYRIQMTSGSLTPSALGSCP